MTNPTSNFGWQMPTSTDLVTDLPADFETFGQAVDTSLADLKGGTTGQVLSKASNTDMDFTWVAQDDSNAIQNTIVDAKGDLIAASAADTPARLAVGTNGYVLSPNSGQTTGLKWQPAPNWHGCRVYKSTTQSISNNTQTTIAFDAEYYDTDGFHSNVTNNSRMIVPAGLAGVYQIRGRINFTSNSTGPRYAIIGLNGQTSAQYDSYVVYQAVNGAETMIDVSTIISMSAGDYVELFGIQNSGAGININGGAIYYTDFSMHLIGV